MSEHGYTAQRYVSRAALAATGAATLLGAVVLSATLTGGASPYPISLDLLAITLPLGFVIAFLHTAVLGLPLYLLLSRKWRLRWWSAALGGAVVGATPFALLMSAAMFSDGVGEVLARLAGPALMVRWADWRSSRYSNSANAACSAPGAHGDSAVIPYQRRLARAEVAQRLIAKGRPVAGPPLCLLWQRLGTAGQSRDVRVL